MPVHASLRSVLRFPRGRSYLVMRDSSEGPMAAEVGANDATRTISLRPGRYFVRGRGPDFLLEGAIEAEAGQAIDVGDERLSRVMFARLVRKGGGVREAAHGPVAGYLFCFGAFAFVLPFDVIRQIFAINLATKFAMTLISLPGIYLVPDRKSKEAPGPQA